MSIVDITKALSASVCQLLIQSGYVAASFLVQNATNATPIVVTTDRAHLLQSDGVVSVSGVVGNTAANDFWNVDVIDPMTFSLRGSVGNGGYVSGGAVKVALVTGKIQLGRQRVGFNQASPQIIFVPVGGDFAERDQGSTANVSYEAVNTVEMTTAQRAAMSAPSVLTNKVSFEVRCWGCAVPPDPDENFRATEVLRDMLILAVDGGPPSPPGQDSIGGFRGMYTCSRGIWEDQKIGATADAKLGHMYVFTLTIDTPVTVIPQPFAPTGTSSTLGVYFLGPDGTPPGELAATIETT